MCLKRKQRGRDVWIREDLGGPQAEKSELTLLGFLWIWLDSSLCFFKDMGTEKERERGCKFKLIRGDHVGFGKSVKVKSQRTLIEKTDVHEVTAC